MAATILPAMIYNTIILFYVSISPPEANLIFAFLPPDTKVVPFKYDTVHTISPYSY